mmetsp:Transcript_1399/g.4203  ORF Transcript_1399/g.4203 Transcript_1399/m.4203 type:complete len:227 (-) Transcript_1399:4877-5557(-)
MSTADRMVGKRDVNGAAMDASPSLTCGSSPSKSSKFCIMSLMLGALPPWPPCLFFALSIALRLDSRIIFCVAFFMAVNCANFSPLSVLSLNSSSNQIFCNAWSSFMSCFCAIFSSIFAFFTFSACSFTLCIFSWNVSAFASFLPFSPSSSSFLLSLSSSPSCFNFFVFADPKPERSATPTCACFNAPTSFAPSPHMYVCRPCCFKRFKTLSLSSGDILAKMETESK